jgi:membrane-bound metal-dependent hydrolase YbcI (DUF457 family)
MYTSEGRLVRNSWLDLTTLDTLWIIFILKEAFFISLPLMALLVAGLLLCLGAVLAPVAGVAWFGYFNTDPRRARLAKNTVEKGLLAPHPLFFCCAAPFVWRKGASRRLGGTVHSLSIVSHEPSP